MEKIFSFIGLVILCFGSYSQEISVMNRVTLETGWGVNYPLRLEDNFFYSPDYFGLKSFYFGANYEVNKIWGLRSTYAYNQLDDSGYSNLGVRRYKIMFEPTFDIVTAIRSKRELSVPRFDIRLHSGIGLSLGQSLYLGKTDDITYTMQFGGMPRLRLLDNIFLQLDCSAVVDFWPLYDTHGVPARRKAEVYILSNIGFLYSFKH